MDIFVTVGMSRWPFDRLMKAVAPLCEKHEVFAQTGASTISLPCMTCVFMPFPDLLKRIETADIVITHAGNTVRLVQRMQKVPIAMARARAWGEMANDHQVQYLRDEEKSGRVLALWNESDLPALVDGHKQVQEKILATRTLSPKLSSDEIVGILNGLCAQWVK